MTESTNFLRVASICLLSCVAPAACKKDSKQPESTSQPTTRIAVPSTKTPPEAGNTERSVAQIAARVPESFSFEKLLQTLGNKLDPEAIEQMERDGRNIPGVGDVLSKGAQAYVIGLQDDGGLVLHVADGCLIVFTYSLHTPPQLVKEATEEPYLMNFVLASERQAEVLSENFDSMEIQVKQYVSNQNEKIQAVAYTNGAKRSLGFFDSSKVDVSKILPSPPSAMDKDFIEELKALRRERDEMKAKLENIGK